MVAPAPPRILVSIVTYHSDLEQLSSAIASVKAQDMPTDIRLIDNHCSEDYAAMLAPFAEDCSIIRAPRNGGFGYGHNLAWLDAMGETDYDYVLCLNPDATLHKGCLRALVDFLEHTPTAGLVVPKVFYPDGTLQPLNKRLPNVLDLALRLLLPARAAALPIIRTRLERYSMLDKGYESPYQLPFASGCCMLFRRSVLARIGGFDEGFFLYFEDADITMRINELAESWFCPDATITHAWQRGSRHSWKLMWIMLQSAGRYFAKWGFRWW